MAAATLQWTAAMVRALPDDGNRYEVIDGELVVTPAPSWQHQDAITGLLVRLHGYLAEVQAGHVLVAPADVEFDDERLVQPDLFVVPLVGGRRPRVWEEAGRLLLAVEVISPASARTDRQLKRRLYQRVKVPEYWIVDVDARLIERWTPDDERPEILIERLQWQPDAMQPALEIELGAYFAGVCGE